MLKTIFEESLVEEDGKRTAYVGSVEVIAALVDVMAAILEGAPGCETQKGLREMTEKMGRKILAQTRNMRAIVEETGKRPFDVIHTRSN